MHTQTALRGLSVATLGVLAVTAGCKPPDLSGVAKSVDDIAKKQDTILTRLEALEKKAAAPAPSQPQRPPPPDPNLVRKVDIGDSPAKGTQEAKVTIVEFSDFQ